MATGAAALVGMCSSRCRPGARSSHRSVAWSPTAPPATPSPAPAWTCTRARGRPGDTCTGADGRYAFDGLISTAADLRLKASAAGFAETWAPAAPDFANAAVSSLASGPVAQDIAVNGEVGALTGQIRDPLGQPASFVTVTVFTGANWQATTTSRTDGFYELANVPTGTYSIEFTRADMDPVWAQATVLVTAGATATANGQFTRQWGWPPPTTSSWDRPGRGRCLVTAVQVSAFNDLWQEVARTTSSDGTFRFEGLVAGGYRFRARRPAPSTSGGGARRRSLPHCGITSVASGYDGRSIC